MNRPGQNRQRAIALVIVLSFIVILTVAAVAFFSLASSERQVSGASVQQSRAALLARSGVQDVIGMLRDEMVAGSETGTEYSIDASSDLTAAGRIYVPVSANTSVPFRFPGAVGNVVKWSAPSQPFFAGSGYSASVSPFADASSLASTSSSSSRNGRFVANTRWARPELADSSSLPQPSWIYLTRSGERPSSWNNAHRDGGAANDRFIIGRYAFILYETGGLLDLNAAGFPSTASVIDIGRKGPLSFADLSVIDPNLEQLVEWRDAGSSATFPTGVLNRDFLTVNPGDRLFTSRRQMLEFLRSIGVDAAAFRKLTHFTRELNAPTWGPEQDASSGFTYRTNRNAPSTANRLIPNVRATESYSVTAYENDGSSFTRAVQQGDPVVARRFSLDKLGWLTRSGPRSGISDEAIQACFGLRWDNGRWTYAGPSGSQALSAISRLDQVAAARREPNFFELLKAGILAGSVGLTTDRVPLGGDIIGINDWVPFNRTTARGYNAGLTATQEELTDSHIIQIGLNIIDQADPDSFPARILFRGFEFYGAENIPYLYRFSQIPYRPISVFAGMTPPGPDRRMVSAWLEPAFWNPSSGPVTDAPSRYRVRLIGGNISYFFQQTGPISSLGPTSPGAPTGALIEFTGSNLPQSASAPATLSQLPVSVTTTRPEYQFTGDGQNWIGFWGGEIPIAVGQDLTHGIFTLNGSSNTGGPRFVLEVDYGNGDFREVQRFGFGATGGLWYGVTGTTFDRCRSPALRATQFGKNDPRTFRFGLQGLDFGASRPDLLGASSFWTPSQSYRGQYNPKDANFTPSDPAGNPWFARESFRYGDNSGTGGGPVYTDRDGVRRPADGVWSSSSNNSLPMRSAVDYRPVQWNRPFRNPGELGTVFRDLPWKSLDFSSAQSGDAALLDLFCVGPEGGSSGVLAGRLQLNSREPDVLASVIAGVARVEAGGSSAIPATASAIDSNLALDLAEEMVDLTTATPLVNRSNLATSIAASSTLPTFSSDLKVRRESIVRALSQAGQTRTWTFLLDLVAQSGRPVVNADGLEDFLVEGERRVWAHIALDRYTGEVVDLQLEHVDE